MHARVVRVDFAWSLFEPNGPTLDPQALARADRLVEDASRAGIKIVATVASTPCWASSAPAAILGRASGRPQRRRAHWPPRDPATYGAFLGALVQRYGTKLTAIEVWNEPDQSNEAYFAGPDKAQNYARLLRAAYPRGEGGQPGRARARRARSSAPTASSCAPSTPPASRATTTASRSTTTTSRSPRCARSAKSRVANGDSKPLWLDEFGWTSCWPHRKIEQEQACVTPATQATNLRNSIREMARVPYVAAAMVYKLQDSRGEDFGAVTTTNAAQAVVPGAQRSVRPTRSVSYSAVDAAACAARAGTSMPAAAGRSATTCSSKPSAADGCATARCSRRTASTAISIPLPAATRHQRSAGACVPVLDGRLRARASRRI